METEVKLRLLDIGLLDLPLKRFFSEIKETHGGVFTFH